LARCKHQQLVERGSSLPARELLRLPRPGRDTVQISDNLRKFIVEDSHKK
jgi:hypothetical protein